MKNITENHLLRVVGWIIGLTGFYLLYKNFGVNAVCVIALIQWGNNLDQYGMKKNEEENN